jgi:hypothetical protein
MGGFLCPNLGCPVLEVENLEFMTVIFHVKLVRIARTVFKNERFEFKISHPHLVHGAIAVAFRTAARDHTKQKWVLAMVVI